MVGALKISGRKGRPHVVDPFYLKFLVKLTPLQQKYDFQSIFARSAMAQP